MRVTYALQSLLAASTTMAVPYSPQHIVLGTDGTVVVGADPSLYFRTSKNQFYPLNDNQESDIEFDLTIKQTELNEVPLVVLPSIHDELLATDDLDSMDQETDEDEFLGSTVIQDTLPSTSWSTLTTIEYSEIPGVYGSVIFAELSCCLVAFIGYLMSTIPLWVGFSRSQKCCVIVAFSLAFLYQFAALGWFLGIVTPELMLGLSSLITRMISLGMMPITTTSFMCRAREICHDHAATASLGPRKSSHSRSSHRHHSRARAS